MYTAKITRKDEVVQGLQFTVEFSDGVKTITEQIIPQDEVGFKYWLKSRLTSLNSIEEMTTKYEVDSVVDLVESVPEKTPTEIERDNWLQDYAHWIRVKTNLVDTGVVPLNNPKVQALLSKVQTGLKPEYIDFL